jgi:hypothetical protein
MVKVPNIQYNQYFFVVVQIMTYFNDSVTKKMYMKKQQSNAK